MIDDASFKSNWGVGVYCCEYLYIPFRNKEDDKLTKSYKL